MGFLLFIIFTFLEITLAVLSFNKCSEKKDWYLYRVAIRAAELAVFLLVMLLPSVTFDFKYKACFFILIEKLIRNAIMFGIKRKSAKGKRSKVGAIWAAVLSIITLGISLIPSAVFAEYHGLENSGTYNVKNASFILKDNNRIDEFENDGSNCEVPLLLVYPEIEETDNQEFPLIIFSHGAFGYSQSNYSTYTELASNGYVVAALDHPHHAFFCKNTEGKTVTVDVPFINEVMYVNDDKASALETYELSHKWLKFRLEDVSFVMDEFIRAKENTDIISDWCMGEGTSAEMLKDILKMTNPNKVGLMGHSLGGATSVTLGRNRKEVCAVVDLDGTMLGEESVLENGDYIYNKEPYPVPLFSPFLASQLGTGTVDAKNCIETVSGLVVEFMNYALKGEGEFKPLECY